MNLAKWLNVKFTEPDFALTVQKTKPVEDLSAFFGILESIDSEELIKEIESTRTIKDVIYTLD